MATKAELIEACYQAQKMAYAPYSKFLVGCAILGGNGKVYTGCNMENQSYGLTICAERSACCKMISDGCRSIHAVAVCSPVGVSPCGACRQVLSEFKQGTATLDDALPVSVTGTLVPDFAVYICNSKTKQVQEATIQQLLPNACEIVDELKHLAK